MRIHPVAEFLARHEPPMKKGDFAKLVGVSAFDLSKVLNGKRRRFTDAACLRVVEATNGAVTLEQLLTWKPPAQLARRDGRLKPRRTAPRRSPVHTQRETSTR